MPHRSIFAAVRAPLLPQRLRPWPTTSNAPAPVPPPAGGPPVWGSPEFTSFNLQQGSTLDLNHPARWTDPDVDDLTFALTLGPLPSGVTLDVASGILSASLSATLGSSGDLRVSASDTETSFWDVPSLQDERTTYDLLGWSRTAGDEAFTFTTTPPALDSGHPTWTIDIHDDTEGDDLWVWRQQKARGYSGALVDNWNAAWLEYFKNPAKYLVDHGPIGGPGDYSLDWDHTYGYGLVLCYMLDGDAAALAAAETLGDRIIWKVCTDRNTLTGHPNPVTANVWPRQFSRWSLLLTYLAQATGLPKWIEWRDALLDCFAQSVNWEESPSSSIAQGGHYFADRATAGSNWNETYGPPGASQASCLAVYDAGRRINNAFYYGLLGEAVWRGYLATGRSDLADKLVKMARFFQYYGHIPSHTVPLIGNYLGADHVVFASNGGRYHKSPGDADNSAVAAYDASIVNTLTWGYKLTGDAALLTMARLCLNNGLRWSEGEPGAGHAAPQVPANEVNFFVDTHRNSSSGVEVWQLDNNKGQWLYCYQVFENGGQPVPLL